VPERSDGSSDRGFAAEIERVADSYRAALAAHGDEPAAVQWSDRDSQERRMQVLTEIGDLSGSKVLDFGCGTGHLLTYLGRSGFTGEYVGLDLIDEMVEVARSKHPDERFVSRDVLEQDLDEDFDYVLVNGTFNNRTADPWGLTSSILRRIWPHVRVGLAFNLMSTYVQFEAPGLAYHDPAEVFSWCKRELSSQVTLRHDYLVKPGTIPFEFAVYVYRSQHSPVPPLPGGR
jgi:SAM-dependent methyltransferase